MAIKFSEFNVGATTSDIDYLVGYKNTDNVQIPVGLVGTNTTYTVSTAQAGANETITLTGSDSSTDLITITAGNDISLTDDGAGNGFTIASTVVADTYTIGTSTNGSSVDVNLDAAAGADSNITLTPASGISIAQTGGVVTITNTAPGDTYTLGSTTNGSAVDINLDAATGTDSAVTLTAGGGLTVSQATDNITMVVGAGDGITVNADDIALASSSAGDGLSYTSGVLSVNTDNTTIETNADTLRIKADGVDFDQLANRYTASGSITTYSGTVSVDWSSATNYIFGSSLTGTITLNFTGFKVGQVLTIQNVTGSQTINLDSDAATSSTFYKLGGIDYDGSTTNVIMIECIDDGATAEFNYSVLGYTSDSTPN